MEAVAVSVFTISLATWVGAIVFQSAVVAPAVFVELDETASRRFLRTLFPRFFRLGLVCGALMTVGLVFAGSVSGWTPAVLALAGATALMLALTAIALWLVPRINAARDAGAHGAARFRKLHAASVALTVMALILGIAALALVAAGAATGL